MESLEIGNSTSIEPISILQEVAIIRDEIISNRRYFHSTPELSYAEIKTAGTIVEKLKSYGITEIFEQIGRTGVIGIIRGAHSGPCIALRADMDALPIVEAADIDYKSTNIGAMHACGHDGHITGLLAAAKILFKEKDNLHGIVKLIFQPAEEGYAGAKAMIADGCLEDVHGAKVDSIYGLHLWSVAPLGAIQCQVGPVMAASDRFTIDVEGKGGHGAAPHMTVDAIVEAASLVTSLQTVISRNKDPLESGVLSIGTIKGGFGYNIIADSVTICGTCRSFTPQVREMMKSRIETICCGVATTFGGTIKMDYEYGYPPTVNNYPECNQIVSDAAANFVGPQRSSLPQKTMGAEDFSYFLEERPGCFFFVGAALPGETRPHHKSVFDFDERAILIGASIYVQIIRNLLK
eukprot:gene13121-17587_t